MRRLRLTLIVLLALVLPLQGLAAAGLVGCGHAGTTTHAGVVPSGHAMHADHAAHAAHASPSAHPGHASTAEAAPAFAFAGPDAGTPVWGDLPCSACAACCTPAAAPVPGLLVASIDADDGVLVARALPPPSFVPAGPERPPRAAVR